MPLKKIKRQKSKNKLLKKQCVLITYFHNSDEILLVPLVDDKITIYFTTIDKYSEFILFIQKDSKARDFETLFFRT